MPDDNFNASAPRRTDTTAQPSRMTGAIAPPDPPLASASTDAEAGRPVSDIPPLGTPLDAGPRTPGAYVRPDVDPATTWPEPRPRSSASTLWMVAIVIVVVLVLAAIFSNS